MFAYEPASDFQVLLVEKEPIIELRKSWAVPKKWAVFQEQGGEILTDTDIHLCSFCRYSPYSSRSL